MPPKNLKQRRAEGAVQLIDIASKLWDDVCSQPTPKKATELWAEHLMIRKLLDEMRTINPPKATESAELGDSKARMAKLKVGKSPISLSVDFVA